MGRRPFAIGDPHFGHDMGHLKDQHGHPARPGTAEEIDQLIEDNWNRAVPKEGATVYVMGDVAIRRGALAILERLHGRKILIKGNHDIFKLKDYLPYFKDIRATHKYDEVILSHIPIHPQCLPMWCRGNIHAHLHTRQIGDEVYKMDYEMGRGVFDHFDPDPRYVCVSAEQIDYTPQPLDEIIQRIPKLEVNNDKST